MAFFDKKMKDKFKNAMTTIEYNYMSTGFYVVDIALNGGIPKGRITELMGAPSFGKTTFALVIAAAAVARGERVAFIDAEKALERRWITTTGTPEEEIYIMNGDLDDDELENTHFHVIQPLYLEQGMEYARQFALSGKYSLIIFDSILGTPTAAAYNGEMTDANVGVRARVLSDKLPVLMSALLTTDTTMIFLNQLRNKIGVMYGDPLESGGGEAIKFNSVCRIRMYTPEKIEDSIEVDGKRKTEIVGNAFKGTVIKYKGGAKNTQFMYRIKYKPEYYIDHPWDIAEAALKVGVVELVGRSYFYKGEKIASSRAAFEQFIVENEAVSEEIEEGIRSKLGVDHGQDDERDIGILQGGGDSRGYDEIPEV